MSRKAKLQNANDIIKQQQELLETQDRKIKEQRDEIKKSIAVIENLRECEEKNSKLSDESKRLKAENRRLASDRKEAIALIEKMADCCLPVIRDALSNEDYSDFCKKWTAVVAQWNALMKKEG